MMMVIPKSGLMMVFENFNGEVLDVIALDSTEVFNTVYKKHFGWVVGVDNIILPTENNSVRFHARISKVYSYVIKTNDIDGFLKSRKDSSNYVMFNFKEALNTSKRFFPNNRKGSY